MVIPSKFFLQVRLQNGKIEVFVQQSDPFVEVCVSDSGKGIPPDELQHVFERFRQVEGTGGGQGGGTGLGLPICRELIHLHQGRIWVESTVGQGSSFFFTLLRSDRFDTYNRRVQERTSFSGH